ncbi:hypothetical protein ACGFNV_43160 [Streptomyces sp. NPDC048751]|uniref:hypothetical protein n=1 Tax=Streptomyces sp. NPDC048751 TaxID=3365591 RepID=UPI0037101B37
MPARRAARPRLLAAALTALAALALTGCRDGEGLRDEGPSHAGLSQPPSAAYEVVPALTHAAPPSGNS